jgi:uncharacterized protein (TIGR02099 family)
MPITSLGVSIAKKIWATVAVVLILLAVYVSVGRLMMPHLDNYQAQVEAVLSEKFGLQVSAESMRGGWQGFQPVVSLQQVTASLSLASQEVLPAKKVIELREVHMELDVIASTLAMQPVFSSLILEGMHLDLYQQPTGNWLASERSASELPASEGGGYSLLNWLLLQKKLLLTEVELTLHPQEAPVKQVDIAAWELRCGLDICSSQTSVSLADGTEATLQLALNIYNKPSDSGFKLQGYLVSPPVSLLEWLALAGIDPPFLNDIKTLEMGAEVWFEYGDGQLVDVRGTLDLPKIRVGQHNDVTAAVDSLRTQFSWQPGTANQAALWALNFSDLTYQWADKALAPTQGRISLLDKDEGHVARLIADNVTLEPVAKTLVAFDSLPVVFRKALSTLNPSGQLADLQVDYSLPTAKGKSVSPVFKLQANLNDVAVSAWRHGPAVSGINGSIELTPSAGSIDFVSADMQLHFPRVFSRAWQFDRAEGMLHWFREGRTLWMNGEQFVMTGEVGDITGRFSSLTSKDGFEPRLSLLMGLENSRLPDAMTFMPDKLLAPNVVQWLEQAFAQGNVKRTRFVLEQRLKKGAPAITKSLAMDVDAEQVDFSFHRDWPHLTEAGVNVRVIDQQVTVAATEARFYDLMLTDIAADYAIKRGASRLKATAQVRGELKQAWQTLTDTPLQKMLFGLANDFQLGGQMQGVLALDVPFSELEKSNVDLDFSTRNGRLNIPSLAVSANDIEGSFQYNTRSGLVAPEVKAKIFNFPVQAAIESKKTTAGVLSTLTVAGHLNISSLAPWVPPMVLAQLAGETDYQAQLQFGRGLESQLAVDSRLKGVAVALPTPFGKTKEQPTTFSFNATLSDRQHHRLRYADLFGYSLMFENQVYQNGEITFGSATPRYVEGNDILVKGVLPEFNYDQWQQLIKEGGPSTGAGGVLTPSKSAPAMISKIKNVQLDVARFDFLKNRYHDVSFTAEQHDGDWRVAFDNQRAKGVLDYYRAPEKPLAMSFDYLYLPEGSVSAGLTVLGSSATDTARRDVLENSIPQQLPALDLNVKKLFLGQQASGRWAFNMRPNSHGVSLESLEFKLRGLKGKGDVDWWYKEGVHSSQFRGKVLIADVAEMLDAWQQTAAIEGKGAKFRGQVDWSGSPANFSLLTMQGPVTLTAKKGRVVDVQSLRLLGVLNFNTLARRLRFDFSDLFKKGFSFDGVDGAFQFEQGKLQFIEPLVIHGPSAKFKVEGQTDLLNEQFEHDVTVVLPVSDNIPFIAALAGFPQAAIPVYIFNQTFGNPFDRFSSVNYKVSGSWDAPDVVLNSYFDTSGLPGIDDNSVKRSQKK